MKKLSKAQQILSALQNDANKNGIGLNSFDLAQCVFGNFHKSTTEFHTKKIKQYMGAVVELAAANNLIVFAVKSATNKKTPEIKSRIIRWRIYVPGQIGADEELMDALISKKRCGEAHTKSFMRMFTAAKEFGAISGEAVKTFQISLQ